MGTYISANPGTRTRSEEPHTECTSARGVRTTAAVLTPLPHRAGVSAHWLAELTSDVLHRAADYLKHAEGYRLPEGATTETPAHVHGEALVNADERSHGVGASRSPRRNYLSARSDGWCHGDSCCPGVGQQLGGACNQRVEWAGQRASEDAVVA